jgi:hypothetical protein
MLESQFHDAKDEINTVQAILSKLQIQSEAEAVRFEKERSDLKGRLDTLLECK